ncbi:hypothetical protein BDQ17DRAFT_1432905 [Cyathus striatus]|nr:hypothetical protein BDQ17DRAFT_1432905 [Cyathus striatus]
MSLPPTGPTPLSFDSLSSRLHPLDILLDQDTRMASPEASDDSSSDRDLDIFEGVALHDALPAPVPTSTGPRASGPTRTIIHKKVRLFSDKHVKGLPGLRTLVLSTGPMPTSPLLPMIDILPDLDALLVPSNPPMPVATAQELDSGSDTPLAKSHLVHQSTVAQHAPVAAADRVTRSITCGAKEPTSASVSRQVSQTQGPSTSGHSHQRKQSKLPQVLLSQLLAMQVFFNNFQDVLAAQGLWSCLHCTADSIPCPSGMLGHRCQCCISTSKGTCSLQLVTPAANFWVAIAHGTGLASLPQLVELGLAIDEADLTAHISAVRHAVDLIRSLQLRVQMVERLCKIVHKHSWDFLVESNIVSADFTKEKFNELCALAQQVIDSVLPPPEECVQLEITLSNALQVHVASVGLLLGRMPVPSSGPLVPPVTLQGLHVAQADDFPRLQGFDAVDTSSSDEDGDGAGANNSAGSGYADSDAGEDELDPSPPPVKGKSKAKAVGKGKGKTKGKGHR